MQMAKTNNENPQANPEMDGNELSTITIAGNIGEGNDCWTQPSARNEYNPEGFSLAAINIELSGVFGPQGDIPKLNEHLAREMMRNVRAKEIRAKKDAYVRVSMEDGQGNSISEPSNHTDPGPDEILIERHKAMPVPEHLIQSGDPSLVALIKANPLALLQSPQVQDALARWSYAAHWGHDASLRKQAKKWLNDCLPRKTGSPGKSCPNLKKLLYVYYELCCYCKCIFTCADAVNDKSKLLKFFPDAGNLAQCGLDLCDVVNPKMKKPAASEISSQYIA
jgi:hypothetical protein